MDNVNIVLVGNTNAGKSSLLNFISSQYVSITSQIAGTTSDIVKKNIELKPFGKCTIIDTPGIDDTSPLRDKRVRGVYKNILKADIVLFVLKFSQKIDLELFDLVKKVKDMGVKFAFVVTFSFEKTENEIKEYKEYINKKTNCNYVAFLDNVKKYNIGELYSVLEGLKLDIKRTYITKRVVEDNSNVLLLMPQDENAPQDRLILAQSQITRELLDRGCSVFSCTLESFEKTLAFLVKNPDLVICDSRVFDFAYQRIGGKIPLTSFSVLFAYYKADGEYFYNSIKAFDKIKSGSNILIMECCSHVPIKEDIGRVLLPKLLKKKFGDKLNIDFSSGDDIPENIEKYDIAIHCGGCMFTRNHILHRIDKFKKLNIPVTNYGLALAFINGILDKIVI